MGKGIIINLFPKEDPKTYAIAYLDLLGTTSKISNDTDGQYLYNIRSIYNMAVKFTEDEQESPSVYGRIETKIFSDNIVLAIPLDSDHDMVGISCLLKFVAFFQHIADIHYHWLIRGGITIGELYIDEILVWGTGLVRAYELENTIAIFPRIVIDRNVLEIVGKNSPSFYPDIDGQFFLNFLNSMEYHDAEGNDNFAETIRKSFAALLSEIKKTDGSYDESAYQKLQWYRNYINAWSKQKYPELDVPLIEEPKMD
jgi:hypothetical protein